MKIDSPFLHSVFLMIHFAGCLWLFPPCLTVPIKVAVDFVECEGSGHPHITASFFLSPIMVLGQ